MIAPSLKLRLALLSGVVATSLVLAVGIVLHQACEQHFVEQDEHDLERVLSLVRHHTLLTGSFEGAALDGAHAMAIEVRRADGSPLFAANESAFAGLPDTSRGLITHKVDGRPWRILVRRATNADFGAHGAHVQRHGEPGSTPRSDMHGAHAARSGNGPAGAPAETDELIVRIGLDITHHMDFMTMFRRVLAVSLLLAALASGCMGWFAARRGLAPLQKMAGHAAGISASRLAERLPEGNVPPELKALADAFNAMLQRLDESFSRLSEFSSDIAHELRTPVSNLRMQTEVMLSHPRSDAEYREVLQSNLEEFDRLGRMVADMLFLAKADNNLLVPQCERIALAAEVRALFDFYEALAGEQGVALTLHGEGSIDGDRLMIRRALSNLLANAIRHTPRGQGVAVRIGRTDANAGDDGNGGNAAGSRAQELRASHPAALTMAIENPGPTIPPEHLPRLFDRFYRVDPSRQRKENDIDGSGLGLAITRSIIEAHGGTIAVSSDDALTRFLIRLPMPATTLGKPLSEVPAGLRYDAGLSASPPKPRDSLP